jgi:2,3-bisphosphoglycerate-independent phosphoglycerate mutase
MHKPKVLLVIMDGWGYSPIEFGNAIAQAKKPTFDLLWKNYAHTLLNSFGQNVGLPWGSIGSSEVGHTSIGSGQLVNQELSKIDKEIASGNFFKNKEILELIKKVQARNGSIHLAGLVRMVSP